LRSTWNYALHLDRFLAWIDRVSAVAPLLNPAEIVRANVHKRYLLELAAHGVPVVPTTLVEAGQRIDVPDRRVVIKPAVGAGSLHTRVFEAGDAAALAHRELIAGDVLVQPYVASVEAHGERSLIWIDGELTHSIRKAPRFAGDREQVDGPFPIDAAERAVAQAALAPYVERILYARVDMARDEAGQPMVMELELVEPSLFFPKCPPALAQFVGAVGRWLSA
jgi:glutathione synthase/RimK-type ligase-like ATP-grasp enzyme